MLRAISTLSARPPAIARTDGEISLIVIGLISFLTLVDLFAAQAILPTLTTEFATTPMRMGVAVNASTFGMAAAGLIIALAGARIDPRRGTSISLACLTIPTLALAFTRDIAVFTGLRVMQGLCMASAFTLTVTYIAEHCSAAEAPRALAAYVTGNVASNLVGRLLASAATTHFGLSGNFILFAALNLSGAALVLTGLDRMRAMPLAMNRVAVSSRAASPFLHWRDPSMRSAFAIGFLILFAFIGTFSYINFELVHAPLSLSPMAVGLVYFVFAPALLTTPMAARLTRAVGVSGALRLGFGLAILGVLLTLSKHLAVVMSGMALVAIGTFLAQAVAAGFVSRTARLQRGAASGFYLASYYAGGLAGSAAIGSLYDRLEWAGAVAAITASLAAPMIIAGRLSEPTPQPHVEQEKTP